MEYIFIVNPASGSEISKRQLQDKLVAGKDLGYKVYNTKAAKDAIRFIHETLDQDPEHDYCFIACGGDGSANEIAIAINGYKNGYMSVYPCGSGNDYVRYFGTDFNDFEKLIHHGEITSADLIKVNDTYCLNVVNVGFEAHACYVANNVRRKPIIGGNNSYTSGIINALVTAMDNSITVEAEGEVMNPDGKMLCCSFANGGYIGGGYHVAPRSINNDGMMDICLVKPLSRLKIISFINSYRAGEHLDNEKLQKYVEYRRVKRATVYSDQPIELCVDGEMSVVDKVEMEIIPQAIHFIAY